MPTKQVPAKTAAMPHRKTADVSKEVTSERIADHLAAFRKAGGTIEVLGVTPVLKRLGGEPAKS